MKKTSEYSIRTIENQKAFQKGFRDGIPIGLGYFAVSFSLGITARNASAHRFFVSGREISS